MQQPAIRDEEALRRGAQAGSSPVSRIDQFTHPVFKEFPHLFQVEQLCEQNGFVAARASASQSPSPAEDCGDISAGGFEPAGVSSLRAGQNQGPVLARPWLAPIRSSAESPAFAA